MAFGMKSDEEKAAEQAAAEALAQEQAVQAEQARVAAAAAQAEEAAWAETLPKWEYKILFLSAAAGTATGRSSGSSSS